MRPTQVVIHHSAAPGKETFFSWSQLREYHESYGYQNQIITYRRAVELLGEGKTIKRPWKGIGYHFGIDLIQNQHEILFGRFPYERGAHEPLVNGNSLGICCIGNFDLVEPSPDQWALCIKLVKWLIIRYSIPVSGVVGHREILNIKTCPGKLFDMNKLRTELQQGFHTKFNRGGN